MRMLITTPVHPPELGGPATFVPLFANHLCRGGNDVVVLTFSDYHGDERLPYRLVKVRRIFLPLRYLWFALRTLQLAARSDVVFACEHPRVFTALIARLTGCKLAVRVMVDTAWEMSFRSGLTREDPETFRARPRRGLERLFQAWQEGTLRRADLVVAVSEHLGALARNFGADPSGVFVSYNLPPSEASPPDGSLEAARSARDQTSGFRLLIVARLVEWKGILDVLDAVERLAGDYELTILGDGPQRDELEARVASSSILRERVRMLGGVGRERVCEHLQTSDLLLLMSRYEGLSHVILEAFDAGLPVVASAIPGNRELVGDDEAGRLVAPGDVEALVRTIAILRGDRATRTALAERARERLEAWKAHASHDRLEKRILDLLPSMHEANE